MSKKAVKKVNTPAVKNNRKTGDSPKTKAVETSRPAARSAGSDLDAKAPVTNASQLTLQASRRFWLLFLSGVLVIVALVQGYGYLTGWGNPERVIQRHFSYAQRYTLAKRPDAAIKEYEKIVHKTKDEEIKRQAWIAMAELYMEKKSWDQAVALFVKLRGSEADTVMSAWAGLKIAEAQQESGQSDAALEMYQQIQAKFPKSDWDAEARLGMGKVLMSQEKYDAAVAAFTALENDYRGGFLAAEALVQSGMCFLKQKKLDQARAMFQKVITEYPEAMADDAKKQLKRLEASQKTEGIQVWGEQK